MLSLKKNNNNNSTMVPNNVYDKQVLGLLAQSKFF